MADKLTLGPELVVNGTFETDTSGWSPGLDTTLAALASRLQVTNGEGSKGTAFNTDPIALVTGGVYVFKASAFVLTSPPVSVQVGDGSSILDVNVTSSGSVPVSQEFLVQVGYDCIILLSNGTTNVGDHNHFDDISLRQVLARKKGGGVRRTFPKRVRIGSKTYVAQDQRELDRIMRRHLAEGDI